MNCDSKYFRRLWNLWYVNITISEHPIIIRCNWVFLKKDNKVIRYCKCVDADSKVCLDEGSMPSTSTSEKSGGTCLTRQPWVCRHLIKNLHNGGDWIWQRISMIRVVFTSQIKWQNNFNVWATAKSCCLNRDLGHTKVAPF